MRPCDDVGRSRLVGHQTDLPDDVSRAEFSNRSPIDRRIPQACESVSAEYEQQELGGISLTDQVSAGFEFVKMHRRQQIGKRVSAKHRERRFEQNAGGVFTGHTVGGRDFRRGGSRVQLLPQASKPGDEPVRCIGSRGRPNQRIDLLAKLRGFRACIVKERAAVVRVARQGLATEA